MILSLGIAAALFALLERSPRLRFRPSPLFRRHFGTDVAYLLTGFVAGGSLAAAYIAYGSIWLGTNLGVPRLAALDLPLWLSTVLALIALDAGNYFAHHLMHRVDWLWEFHKVHHSSPELDWLATFRSHLFEQALRRVLAPVLLILMGFPPGAVALAGVIFICWAVFNHSNLRPNLGFIEPIFITPRLHRVHHLDDARVRNLGTLFSFWDRMRGTLSGGEVGIEDRFGNGEAAYPQNWLSQFVEPVRHLSGLRRRSKLVGQTRET